MKDKFPFAAFKSSKLKQASTLLAVNIIGIPIGIGTSVIVTNYLGPKEYGDYKFITSVFEFAMIIFTFGLYQASNRLLVINSDEKTAKEIYGTSLIITAFLFVISSIAIATYTLLDSNIESKGLTNTILFLVPFGWVFLLNRYFGTLLYADNKIYLLSIIRLFPKIGFLVACFFLIKFFTSTTNSILLVWALFLFTQIIVYLFVLIKIKLSFKNFITRLREIWHQLKIFGFNVYLGSVVSLGFAQLATLLISYFGHDNSGVGFYTLAVTITMPLTFIPNTIATSHYKEFSNYNKIPVKLTRITILLSIVSLFALVILISPFVKSFYGSAFSPVIQLSYFVALGVLFHGFADYFNRFLGANGQGKSLRNTSFIVGVSTLILSVILISMFDEKGAAIARLFSGLIYLITILYFYFNYIKKKSN
ncbi:oligosaccharide flippase family protein [Saccharicrinis sp. FJH2]|uniref:oligosaccharide flippase family protein n=1 Tax=Saccharicrinis sp. FJH65 TaxID=3344659 RepID=UPI0035F2AF98